MPRQACVGCGGTALRGRNRCAACAAGTAAPVHQQRAYRGLAAYRDTRTRVIAAAGGICAECHRPGADEIDHVIPYSAQDPATRDDPSTWHDSDFRAVHARCNKQRGTRPLEAR